MQNKKTTIEKIEDKIKVINKRIAEVDARNKLLQDGAVYPELLNANKQLKNVLIQRHGFLESLIEECKQWDKLITAA